MADPDRPDVREVPERINVETVLLHLGAVRFPITGPIRYTMTARDALELCALTKPQTAIPVHYSGWSHFKEGRSGIERELADAPSPIRDSFLWLAPGTPATVSV